jgi:membrane-anchored mycosin MYCP
VLVVGVAAPSYAVDGPPCVDVNQVDQPVEEGAEVTDVAEEGSPAAALDIEAAQARVVELSGRAPGAGVTVAVLDSGVRAQEGLDVVGAQAVAGTAPSLAYHQGTMLAGIIAGPVLGDGSPVGIAPAATIYDQRVYDTGAANEDGLTTPTSASLAAGLEAIAPLVGRRGIRIVTVGVRVPDTPELRAAVERVTGRGAILVAASGGRLDEGEDAPSATFRDGEDSADTAFPAGYSEAGRDRPANPRVLSVTTTAAPGDGSKDLDLTSFIQLSSAIDVAVPTAGAVSLAPNEDLCTVFEPSTAVAAAEVSGVLALLMTVFPRDTPEQVLTRLLTTASGVPTDGAVQPDTRVGRGIVQPLEALDRPLVPARDGTLPLTVPPEREAAPATLPTPEPDVLASTRDNAVWWGLLGGGALVVLVLLRPVLSRLRGR